MMKLYTPTTERATPPKVKKRNAFLTLTGLGDRQIIFSKFAVQLLSIEDRNLVVFAEQDGCFFVGKTANEGFPVQRKHNYVQFRDFTLHKMLREHFASQYPKNAKVRIVIDADKTIQNGGETLYALGGAHLSPIEQRYLVVP